MIDLQVNKANIKSPHGIISGSQLLQIFTPPKWKGNFLQEHSLLGVPHFGSKSPQKGVVYINGSFWAMNSSKLFIVEWNTYQGQFEENLSTV